jgi:endogenous inhibitor of DNA gyrase (YacG/DUF329 family)
MVSVEEDLRCPHCGNPIPAELGQHAQNLVSGTVTCPHCGKSVPLRDDASEEAETTDVERATAAPPGRHEGVESFTGEETLEGLADEVRDKPT